MIRLLPRPLQRKPRRLPKRKDMTLCIAVACEMGLGREPRIVLCTDWQQEMEGIGAAENRNKLSWVKEGWPVLIADILCHAAGLTDEYGAHLGKIVLDRENVLSELKKPAQRYKRILANDYLNQLVGFDYNEFLERKAQFPDEFFRERIDEISRIKLGASLIISGFVECGTNMPLNTVMQPCLCVVEDSEDHHDVVRLEQDFAAIGSGAFVATAVLFWRAQHWERDLLPTIYSVFEAHRVASSSKVPGVGENMTIDVLANGEIREVSEEGYSYCEYLYSRFGPRAVRKKDLPKFEMKEEYLDTFNHEALPSWGPHGDRAGYS